MKKPCSGVSAGSAAWLIWSWDLPSVTTKTPARRARDVVLNAWERALPRFVSSSPSRTDSMTSTLLWVCNAARRSSAASRVTASRLSRRWLALLSTRIIAMSSRGVVSLFSICGFSKNAARIPAPRTRNRLPVRDFCTQRSAAPAPIAVITATSQIGTNG